MFSNANARGLVLPSLRSRAVLGLVAWMLASACGGGSETDTGSSDGTDTDPSSSTAQDTDPATTDGLDTTDTAPSESSDGTTGAELPLPTIDDLAGDWVSPGGCEVPPGAMGTSASRVFSFTADGEFSFAFSLSGGETCEAPLFDVVVDGTFSLGGPSTVPGAIEADFVLGATIVTPTDAGVGALQQMCPDAEWVAGQATDVSDGVCVGFPIPVAATCPQEYDIASIDAEGRLFFGSRAQDICVPENRPTMLNSTWLVRP